MEKKSRKGNLKGLITEMSKLRNSFVIICSSGSGSGCRTRKSGCFSSSSTTTCLWFLMTLRSITLLLIILQILVLYVRTVLYRKPFKPFFPCFTLFFSLLLHLS
ncbi:hypothetical protein V8G54_002251, partial [Vigna mungo]